ncbi:hypothetical protein ADK53_06420 [Streptomyces sp. WM6373]|nr:hypothetical protein ADK53_06420 [Streptomyces sp. WM6373]KOU73220.1 hypothetical protein ADK96_04940 [Streptomyces sp. IGB124]KOU87116.1 hypothetical protein ADK61_04645 [Streptomyces sp. XY66]KOV26952.1 hypothetical protein ADK90_03250 [Streptomyces sp. XY413]KOV44539.1 hypothetical protein ADK97_04855 [Streptomyces sp. H021]
MLDHLVCPAASTCSASARARYSETTEGLLPVFFPVWMVGFLVAGHFQAPCAASLRREQRGR